MITEDTNRARTPLDALPYLSIPRMLQVPVFVKEARNFLNTYFRGSWVEKPPSYPYTRHINVSVDCFAYFTKLIFKRVFNRELITMSTDMSYTEFSITYHFSTSYLEERYRESLAIIAKKSGFTFELDEGSATLKAPLHFSPLLNIYAGRPLYTFNALKDAFDNDYIFPV